MNFATWSRRHIDRYGDMPVLVIDDRVWNSVQLHDDACKLASGLIALGVKPGDRVLIVLPSGRDALVAATATWMAGAVLVALHPEAPSSEVEYIVAHCAPAITISTTAAIDDLIARHAPLGEPVPRSPSDPAQLTYTSGSTGVPKATIYSHGGMDAVLGEVARMTIAQGDPEQVALVTLPITAFGGFLLRSRWTARQKLVVVPRFDPRDAHLAITRHGVTQLSLVPSIAEALLSMEGTVPAPTTVREIRIGGAHLPAELSVQLERYFGARPLNTYGMTEAGGMITFDEAGPKPGSVGRASPGVDIKIVDGEGRSVATGHEGEIFVRTPWQASGYWGTTPDAKVFQPDGWLRTGDRGRLDVDGSLYLSGRSKDIIIQGGHNVVPIEVHEVVRAMPGVAACAIIGIPDPFLGEMVVVWVVRRPGTAITEDDVLAHCRASLDPRKWPGRVFFTDELPMSAAGKVKLEELRQRTTSTVAEEPEIVGQLRRLPPDRRAAVLRAEIARELAVLVSTEPTDPYKTFSNYGLTSLRAVQLANALSRRLARSVPVTLLFRHSTIDSLSRALLDSVAGAPARRSPHRATIDTDPIAIVGAACRLPGGVTSPEEFWNLLQSGRDTVREAPEGRWRIDPLYDPERPKLGKSYVRTASFVERADEFDAAFFGLSAEAEGIDPQHRMILETSWEALERAGHDPRAVPGLVGMMLGISSSSYPPRDPLGVHRGMALGRVCHFLNLRGPSQTVDTTCSSSLVALHDAVRTLQLGECDTALVGGVSLLWSADPTVQLCQLELLATDGRSKAFDASGDGFGQGEGCIVLVLERLSDARARGKQVLAIVRGTAINHDGHSSSLTAPNPEAQEDVIRSALAVANVEPDAVQYVEAHGTGTVLGDPIEVAALTEVFGARRAPLAIGSVKSNIGHLEAAAGLAGVLKVVLALQHRQLPASLHFKTPNPHIPWDAIPIRVQHELGPWPAPDAPLVAGISSFGMSGTNAHVVLEEPPANVTQVAETSGEAHVLVMSAKSDAALRAYAERYAEMLEAPARDDGSDRDIAYTASVRATHHEQRLAIVGANGADWAAKLRGYLAGDINAHVVTGRAIPRRIAMVFGGQGSQWYAMGRELFRDEPVFRAAVEEVAALIDAQVTWKLVEELARTEATSRIEDTEIAQPALFALQVGLVALWAAWGVTPLAVAGHSLGEITAAYVAGALTLEQAARLVVVRGQILQRATGKGRMATVTANASATARVLAGVAGVEIAASNAPHSTTICGPAESIERALSTLAAAGVDAKQLKVNYAFHHAMLAPLAAELTASLSWLEPMSPRLEMISTVTGGEASRLDAAYWGSQVRQQVRFEEATRALLAARYDTFIEIGAHPVLVPAIAQTADDAPVVLVPSLRRREPETTAMRMALGALHCAGVAVDWSTQFAVPGRVATLPSYPWQRERYWLETVAPQVTHRIAPYIDRRTELPHAPGTHLFELDSTQAITPAVLVELAAESVAQVRNDGRIEMRDVRFERTTEDVEPRALQLVLHADGGRFEIFARAGSSAAERWAHGQIGGTAIGDVWPALAELQLCCARDATDEIVDDGTILERVFAGNGEALGRLRAAASGAPRYELDPAVLTAAWQMIGAVSSGGRCTPIEIAALTISQRNARGAWLYVRWGSAEADGTRTAELVVLDERGQTIAEARGVKLEVARTLANDALDRWLYTVAWRDAVRNTKPDARGPWLVFADRGGVGASLGAALAAAGQRVVMVEAGPAYSRRDATHAIISVDDPAHVTLLLDESFASEPPRRIVHLWSLDATGAQTADALEEARRLSVKSAMHVVQAVAKRDWGTAPRLFLVTRGAQATRNDESVPGFAQSMLWGLGASLVHEMPELTATLIDLDPTRTDGQGLFDEVTRANGEDRIAVRGGARRVARIERYKLQPTGAVLVRADRTYLVTGGLGALGLVIAARLVAQGARHVALMGRGTPHEHARAAIAALGANVRLVHGDVADAASLSRVLGEVRATMPALGGVVHAAGVFDAETLLAMTEPSLQRVLAPKLAGTWNLSEQTAGDNLEMFVLFSSVSAFLGLPQAHYAAANAFLDGFAHWRRSRGLPATSVNWGPWGDVGAAGGRDKNLMRQGLAAILPVDGAELFVRLAGDRARQIAVMNVRWRQWRENNPRAAGIPLLAEQTSAVAAVGPNAIVKQIQSVSEAQRGEVVADYIRGVISKVSGVPAAEIRADVALAALGLDSLMMVSLKNLFERELSLTVSTATLYAYPSLKELAAWITGRLFEARENAIARPVLGPTNTRRARLLPPQRGTYRIERGARSNFMNRIAMTELLEAALDVNALERALAVLRARHGILRTRFVEDGTTIWQETLESVDVPWLHVVDLSALSSDEQGRADASAHEELILRPYDLANAEVMRVILVKLGRDRHRLTIAVHRIAGDLVSLKIFHDELLTLLHALESDPSRVETALPPTGLQFLDLADYLARLEHSELGARQRAYWGESLRTAVPLQLPTDLPRAELDARRAENDGFFASPIARTSAVIGASHTAIVDRIARSAGVTEMSVLLAALGAHLSSLTGQRDLAIVSHLLYRHHPGLERTLGMFVNPLIMRFSTQDVSSFRELVMRTHASVTGAFEHGDFDVLRAAPHLFRLWFNYLYMGKGTVEAPPSGTLVRTPTQLPGRYEQLIGYDVVLFVAHHPDRIELQLAYNLELFSEAAAVQFLQGYVAFIESLETRDPAR
ncbi:MAG TPA: SDR family NAD(P)-dependent oxidoreductase [Kofleriaceae bacterium]|jgi:myxalamid-type polyketide synthase MxaE and MxaD